MNAKALTVISLVGLLLLQTACASPTAERGPTAGQETGPTGSIDVAVASDIIGGDFHVAQGGGNWPMSNFVPEGLVSGSGGSPVTGKLGPLLATEWKALEDGKVWEFKLRKGVEFHNGEPFNAEAVK